jgi:tryptophan-rich sensory protein
MKVRYMDRITLRSAALAAACILVPLVSGAAVGILTMSGVNEWYTTLNKPWFTPPNYVFGPVWTILYILMGISLYLVISQGWENETVKTGFVLFAAQLGVNLLWSIIFFGLHSPLASLVCILVLLALIVATIISFSRLSKPAAVLLLPYLAWVCIATALNAGVVFLN